MRKRPMIDAFLDGAARVLDLGCVADTAATWQRADDARALLDDLRAVAKDIQDAGVLPYNSVDHSPFAL
jgi:hypothetical protein